MSWSFREVGKVDSTQLVASRLVKEGAPEGVVIIASEQASGRGRMGREWYSPRGGLYMSLILRPKRKSGLQLLPLIGALAVADGIKKDTGIVPFVRWPNDVTIHGKKVAGVIAEAGYKETIPSHLILGLGVNCNFASRSLGEIAKYSTTLMDELGVKMDITILRDKILQSFGHLYAEWGRGVRLVSKKKDWISTVGKKIEVIRKTGVVVCTAEDVNDDGTLVIRTELSRETLRAEDIERIREIG
ncbi:MAG: biotin--[acetyl-CoA-carboxylase] ligase [Thaumarchaeota archaeon]|nr:biotin--[acetyl-CoA-carboxylase] ligase [Nitrososphaerota archaeon]